MAKLKYTTVIIGFIILNSINYSCEGKNNSIQNYQQIIDNKINTQNNFENFYIGEWTLNTYIGNKIFKDKLSLKKENNVISGNLSVPKVFTSRLEKINVSENKLYFEIMVDEGKKPYRVKYECIINKSGETFVGFATLFDSNELIGGFVAIKEKDRK